MLGWAVEWPVRARQRGWRLNVVTPFMMCLGLTTPLFMCSLTMFTPSVVTIECWLSQAKPTKLGLYTPEEPAAEAVAGHQRLHSQSGGQPPAEVGDPPTQRLEERPVECDTRISRSRRPVAVEDDETVDESSYSTFPPGHPRGNRSLRL